MSVLYWHPASPSQPQFVMILRRNLSYQFTVSSSTTRYSHAVLFRARIYMHLLRTLYSVKTNHGTRAKNVGVISFCGTVLITSTSLLVNNMAIFLINDMCVEKANDTLRHVLQFLLLRNSRGITLLNMN